MVASAAPLIRRYAPPSPAGRRTNSSSTRRVELLAPRLYLHGHVFRADVERDHEAVRAVVLEGLLADVIGLDLVRHEDEAIVPRRPEVPEVLDHDRIRGHPAEPIELHLGDLSAAQFGRGHVLR